MMKKDRRWSLANENIAPLLMRLSAPAIVAMMVMALYNLVDTIFVGQGVGVLAIAGITVSFPMMIIIMALTQMVGIGGGSIVSRCLGSDDKQRANRTLGNVTVLSIIIGLSIAVLSWVFIDDLLLLFGATEGIFSYAREYLSVVLIGTPFISFAMAANSIVRAEGNAKLSMIVMVYSAVTNILLDALFIFGFGWGIKGAALATVISQVQAAVNLFFYFIRGKSILEFHSRHFSIEPSVVREIIAVGSSALVRQGAGSFTVIFLNRALAKYGGDVAIGAFGIIHRLTMFTFMPMLGIGQGFQPIAGFNYGAEKYDRVKKTLRLAIIITSIWSTIIFVLFETYPHIMIRIFSNDPVLLEIGVPALRIISIAMPFLGFQLIVTGLFQALGKAFPAIVLALSRQVLFLLPAILILPFYFNLNGIWISFPIADGLATLITFLLFVREVRFLGEKTVNTVIVREASSGC